MVLPPELTDTISNRLFLAAAVFIVGTILGYLTGEVNRRLLERAGVDDAVEGTAFERTMRGFGTSTVSLIAKLSMWFIIGVSFFAAISVANVRYTEQFWAELTSFIPMLFVAVIVLITGIVIGDKLELVISERLRGIKFPQITIIPKIAKYSVVYIAVLIALGQIGVATSALLIFLAVYGFGVVLIGGIALKDLLAAGAAGIYVILNQPYSVGDEIQIDDRRGIVQEITALVTHVENDDEEYIIPNNHIFEYGVTRKRHH